MRTMTARYSDEETAEICHAAISVLQRIHHDPVPSTSWFSESDHIKESAIAGVRAARAGATPRELHDAWMQFKIDSGWVYGTEKDPAAAPPTHPCLVAYDLLPQHQKDKDELFSLIVVWASTKLG